jgi:predicted methyltransferase
MHAPSLARALAVLTLAALALSAPAQAQSGRDTRQRVPDVLAALALNSGSRVADVGAGSGYFLPHLSAAVGPTGRVYGVDISETALSQMRRLIEEKGLANVVVVQGEVDDPHLPAQSLSSALMVDAYHEMTEHESMLARTFESLEAGGRLVVLDLAPYDESTSRAAADGSGCWWRGGRPAEGRTSLRSFPRGASRGRLTRTKCRVGTADSSGNPVGIPGVCAPPPAAVISEQPHTSIR